MDLQPHIEKFATRMGEVETELGDPKVFENNRRAQELGREYARLKNLVALGERLLKAKDELEENRALAAGDDAEMAEMAAEEIPRWKKKFRVSKKRCSSASCRPTPRILATRSWKFAPALAAMKRRFSWATCTACTLILRRPRAGAMS